MHLHVHVDAETPKYIASQLSHIRCPQKMSKLQGYSTGEDPRHGSRPHAGTPIGSFLK